MIGLAAFGTMYMYMYSNNILVNKETFLDHFAVIIKSVKQSSLVVRKRLLAHDWLESWARVFFHSMFSVLSKMPLIDL